MLRLQVIMFAPVVPANNHGSAAAATTAAALPPLAAGGLSLTQPPMVVEGIQAAPSSTRLPPAAVMTRAATESLGTMGIEYGIAPIPPDHGRPRRAAASADSRASDLGAETRSPSPHSPEDTLTLSPDLPDVRHLGPLKRDARARPGSSKRMAVSAFPPSRHVRKA